eukprot:TRINITY_DN1391_c0_g1_i1.p1 TRINITY_DN1391_c0_g1~~TRINITY_DN1391_c0_g1_i1.p1  ORF type:complete len:2993 (-),score=1010.05 TRINITY_DN1391_c0_g1_i1:45-9023(-)
MRISLFSVVALATLLFLTAEATHFRFGTITWSVSSALDYNTVFFTINTGWRRSFYDAVNGNPGRKSNSGSSKTAVGDTLIQQTYNNGAGRYYNFNPGDGNKPFTGQYVTSVNERDDWIMTTWNYTYKYPKSDGEYIAYHTQSSRILSLKNNADQPWIISSKVIIRVPPNPIGDYVPNSSPITAALPIIPVRYGVDLEYKLPGTDPNLGDTVTFSNADPQTMGGNAYCPQLTVDSEGVVRFLASKTQQITVGAYQTQQILTDRFGAYIPVDYILNVTRQGGLCQCSNGEISSRGCTDNGGCGGISGCPGATCLLSDPTFIFSTTTVGKTTKVTPGPETRRFDAGDLIYLPIVADDLKFPASGYPVEIYSSGVPSGAVITPQVDCKGQDCACVGNDCKNPQIVYLRWQTTSTSAGIYSMCFGVVQPKTSPATYYAKGQTCITLNIVPPRCNSGTINTANPICRDEATFVASDCCTCPPGYDPSSRCLTCKTGYFGPECKACPNCNNGTCSDGIGGDGTCICDPGYEGINCQNPNFKECDPNQFSYIQSATTSDSFPLNPTSAFLYMAVDSNSAGSAKVPFVLKTPTTPSLDVVFIQDLSASTYTADIDSLKNKVGVLMNSLVSLYPGTSASFASIAGTPSSYRSYGPLASFVPTLTSYIGKMQIDATASQSTIAAYSAISQAVLDENFQWRYNSYRVVVMLTRKADSGVMPYATFAESLASNSANVLFLVQNAGAGTGAYSSAIRNFGMASATGNNQEDWNTVFLSSIRNLVQQVAVGVTGDTNGMFVTTPPTSSALGSTINREVEFRFPAGVKKGSIRNLPTPTVSFLGWASSFITIVLNRAPTSQDSVFYATQDIAYPFQIPSADADNNLLTVKFTLLPQNAKITNNGAAVALNTPYRVQTFSGSFLNNYLWSGQTTFKYILNDGCDDSAEYKVDVTVRSVNYPPTVQSGSYNLNQGSFIEIVFTPLLSDVDNTIESLRVFVDNTANLNGQISTGSNQVSGGELTNQRLIYTPSPSFYGNSSLTYYARDNAGQSTTATITFVVKFVNKNPAFSGPLSPPCAIGATTTFTVSISDADIPDSANINFTSALTAGRVTDARFRYSATEASLVSSNPIFTNLPSNPGPASFTVSITTDDLAVSRLGSITFGGSDRYGGSTSITISPVAVANKDPFFTTVSYTNSTSTATLSSANNRVVLTGDQSVSVTVTGSDTDGTHGVKLIMGIVSNPSSGTIFTGKSNTQVPSTLPYLFDASERSTFGSSSNFTFVYKPNEFFFGSDSVTVLYRDVLGGVASQVINFNVLFFNHAPSLRASDSAPSLPIGANYTLTFTVSDPDSIDSERITVDSYSLVHIQNIWYSRNGVIRSLGNSLAKDQVIASGLSPRDSFSLIIQTADTATSSLGSLTLVVSDLFGGSGLSTVSFTAANSAPPFVVEYSPSVTLEGDSSVLISVRASDTDGQQGASLFFVISNLPQFGTITTGKGKASVSSNVAFPGSENYPQVLAFNSTSNYTFTYTPNKFWSGSDSLKFFVRDILSVASPVYTTSLTVTFVNHPPVLTGPSNALCRTGFVCRITFSLSDPDAGDSQFFISKTADIRSGTLDGVDLTATSTTDRVNLVNDNVLRSGIITGTRGSILLYLDLYVRSTTTGNIGDLTVISRDSHDAESNEVSVNIFTSENNAPYQSSSSSNPANFEVIANRNLSISLTGSDDDSTEQTENVLLVITSLPKNGVLVKSDGTVLNAGNYQVAISKNASPNSTFSLIYVPDEFTHGADSFSYYFTDLPGAQSQTYTADITTLFYNHAPTVTTSSSSVTCPLGANCTISLSVLDPDVPDSVSLFLTQYSLTSVDAVYSSYASNIKTVLDRGQTFSTSIEFESRLPSGSSSSLILSVRDVALGPLGTLKVQGTDESGLNSVEITIEVFAGANSPPKNESQTPQNPVTLTGDSSETVTVVGSDPDGNQGQDLTLVVLTSPASGYLTTLGGSRVPTSLPSGGFSFDSTENTPGVMATTGKGSSQFSFTYTPNTYFFGKDSFTYAFVDPMGSSTPPITVVFDVEFFNHAPTISTLLEKVTCGFGKNCTMEFSIVDYDDATQDHESVEINLFNLRNVVAVYAVNPANGTEFKLSNQPNGVILSKLATRSTAILIVTFDSEISGNLGTFVINARDSYGASSEDLTISVTAANNNPPTLLSPVPSASHSISYSLLEDESVLITVTGTDLDGTQGNALKLVIDRLPSNGRIEDSNGKVSADGIIDFSTNTPFTGPNPGTSTSTYSITYIPNPLFYGQETFDFHFVDSLSLTSRSYVAVLDVTHVNHPPTGSSFTASGMSSVPLLLNQFVGNDVDKVDTVYLEIISLPSFGILRDSDNGSVTLSDKREGTSPLYTKDKWALTFTSDDLVSGTPLTTFQFRFFDGTAYSVENYTASINIEVSNYPPVAFPVTINGSLNQIITFVANASDPNDAPGTLTINIVRGPTGGLFCSDEALFNCFTTGSIYRNESTPIYYKPNQDQYGTPYDYFTYSVSDPARLTSQEMNVTININFVNKPPVAQFQTTITVYENDQVTFTLSASDDRTPVPDIKFTIETIPHKGNLTSTTDEGINLITGDSLPLTLLESKVLTFAPIYLENGDNYTSFRVNISDTDGGITIVTVVFNVIPVNQPPVIHYDSRIYSTRRNGRVQIGFTGSDVDSPLSSLVAVITRFPNRGELLECSNWSGLESDTCEDGPVIVSNPGDTLQRLSAVGDAIWRFVFVPFADETGKSYANPSFVLLDDFLARSEPYVLTINVLKVNRPPAVNASIPASTPVSVAVPLNNVTVSDFDAADLPILVVLSVNEGTIRFTEESAYKASNNGRPPACQKLNEGRVINCTTSQGTMAKYLPTLQYEHSAPGNYTFTIFVDDLGTGAEREERGTSRLTATASSFVEVNAVAVVDTPRNLSLTIGLASAGGALLAAAAVGAAARFLKKPEDSLFQNMLDFDQAGVQSNPLYEGNDGSNDNPLYEDETAV